MTRDEAIQAVHALIFAHSKLPAVSHDSRLLAEMLVDFFDDVHAMAELARKEYKKSPQAALAGR